MPFLYLVGLSGERDLRKKWTIVGKSDPSDLAFAERLGIKSKWKTFEQLWGISNLAQEKWDMQETGTTPTRSKDIDKIFDD